MNLKMTNKIQDYRVWFAQNAFIIVLNSSRLQLMKKCTLTFEISLLQSSDPHSKS